MDVSVIIPVYNTEKYLAACVDSILNQVNVSLEIILVDDGSTDGSGDICDTFSESDDRCVVVHQKNQGLWAARNTGQIKAKGSYVLFVDSDDYIHIDMIKCLYESLIQNPQCGFAMCRFKKTESFNEDTHAPGDTSCQILSTEQIISFNTGVDVVWNKLYRRSLIEGLFARNYSIAQDVDYNCRVYLRLNYVSYVNRELYFWMQRPNSAMHTTGYHLSYLMTVTDIYYRILLENSKDNELIKANLLRLLYWRLLSLKSSAWRTRIENNVTSKCKTILKNTWYSYLSCKRIGLFRRGYVLVLLWAPPVVSHWSMLVRRRIKKSLYNC
jgi:glycosyltransferase involved in cell wall biosynthesis